MWTIARRAAARVTLALLLAAVSLLGTPARAADPIRIGFSMALTGGVAPNGKQLLQALEIWRDDVNAKGGLLGRPVELVYYDDQSNPNMVPGIYTKLISVDKVDLLLGPYATNMIAPALPVIMQAGKTTIGILGVNVNRQFNYPRYFSMIPGGNEGTLAFSRGWFEIAMAQNPKPKTVALVAADAEFGKTACDGARDNAKRAGLEIVYDKGYPPFSTDLMPVVRAVQATNAELVFVCGYPPDNVAFVRSANEINFNPKMWGGAMVGLLATPIKMQLGALLNGIVIMESFVPSDKLDAPGLKDVFAKYQAKAPALGIDPLGIGYVPFGYAAGQVLAQAVEGTKSLDHGKLAEYIHSHGFATVAGEISYGADGEWSKSRQLFTQFQNVSGGDLNQFRDSTHQVILWPAEYKTGDVIYPYEKARKK
jgi:branched-chain amino acid transport system substrate-binding protein